MNAPQTVSWEKTSKCALASFILALLAMLLTAIPSYTIMIFMARMVWWASIAAWFFAGGVKFVASILAVIFGHIACHHIKRDSSLLPSKGYARAGLILGYVSLAFMALSPIGLALIRPMTQEMPEDAKAKSTGTSNILQHAIDKGNLLQKENHAKQIWFAMKSIAAEGTKTGNKALGYPADAGLTTVEQLKTLLLENAMSAQDIQKMHLEDFLIGNVSASDPPDTIFMRTTPEASIGGVSVLFLNGKSKIYSPDKGEKVPDTASPREPPYLKP